MQERYQSIYLSPHPDDAALSCAGQIIQQTRSGRPVLVVTVAAGDPPAQDLSPLALSMQKNWGLLQEAGLRRKSEDARACKILGADFIHWEYPECIYRKDYVTGAPYYPDLTSIFGVFDPRESPLVEALSEKLKELPPAERIVAPLGAGHHVDHQWVRKAAEQRFGRELFYYEDFPYCGRFLSVWKLTQPAWNWNAYRIKLEERDIRARCDAIAAYESQARVIFKDQADMELKVRRYIRRVGGERLWKH